MEREGQRGESALRYKDSKQGVQASSIELRRHRRGNVVDYLKSHSFYNYNMIKEKFNKYFCYLKSSNIILMIPG